VSEQDSIFTGNASLLIHKELPEKARKITMGVSSDADGMRTGSHEDP
jgi:hypothetical protein